MGFSVSGSAAIIFAAMFLAFGTFYTASTNGFETINDAREERHDRTLTQENTAINLTSAVWDSGTSELTVSVNNTGASHLTVSDVDLLADNEYLTGYSTSVDGDATTDLWLPHEQLTVTVTSLSADPGRVKVVTQPGVAATSTTEVR